MIDNKLIELYNSLHFIEKKACTVFLKSPYHNRRKDVLQLWDYLQEQKNATIDPQKAYSMVYPTQVFDDHQWRHLQSFLTSAIETFLVQRAWTQSPLLFDLHLADVYREKNLHKPLEYTLRRASALAEKMPRDSHYYHLMYQAEWQRYAAQQNRQGRTQGSNIANVIHSFDMYVAANRLRLACLMESHKAVAQIEHEDAFLPVLLQFVATGGWLETPIVALYYHCYQALTQGGEDSFRAFRRALEEQSSALPESESRTFTLLAINFCIRRLNTGEGRYVREAFDLYRIGLETGALLEHGQLSRFAFKNIVALGLKLEAFEWVTHFIAAYEPYLEEKYRAAHRDYNLAKVHFAQQNYDQAMPLLARVGESDLLLNLDSRIMLLKMYYERGELDALDALIASFKIHLLRKKKLIGYHSGYYLNTVRYIRKLMKLNSNDKKAKALFREEILRGQHVIEKEWLLKQVGDS